MACILHQSSAPHGHGWGYERMESTSGSPAPGHTSVRAAFVHVVGDLLQSLGVLVAAIVIYFKVHAPPHCAGVPGATSSFCHGQRRVSTCAQGAALLVPAPTPWLT